MHDVMQPASMKRHKILLILIALTTAFSAGDIHAEVQYDKIFPLYVESCSLTRIRRSANSAGAPWGHSGVYVKGMCRDKSVPYPRVRVCADEVDLTDFNSGTFISVEPAFKNTNWVAIEGGNFAFHGDLNSGEGINAEVLKRTSKAAVDSGAFQGIKFHKQLWRKLYQSWWPEPLKSETLEENMARATLGTHYAIDFGRTSYCNLIPINRSQLENIVTYLNDFNEPFINRDKKYQWDPARNNCVHIARNVLAAANVISYKPVGRHYPLAIFDLLIPGQHFVSLAQLSMDQSKLSVTDLFKNKVKRQSLEKNGMPSISHGAIIRIHPMRTINNESFISSLDMALGVFTKKRDILGAVLSRNVMNNLRPNLKLFETVYSKLKVDLKPLSQLASEKKRYAKPRFKAFYEKYVEWLDGAITEVYAKMEHLDRLEESYLID
ncbi:MAG: hypothetical protein ABIQ95_09310 [Bdellovibrionia bacterium]